MPLAFPSHQGLIAPLWRRWPERFDVLALCIGAAVPDIVDGIGGAYRGYLGQWYGHSLVGLFALCLPTGLLLTWLTLVAARRVETNSKNPRVQRAAIRVQTWHTVPPNASGLVRLWFVSASVWLGAFSHLFIDFISHGNFMWLYPWYTNGHFFPAWWYIRWFQFPLPGYREPYTMGPYLIVWIFLSLLGIALFLYPWPRRKAIKDRERKENP